MNKMAGKEVALHGGLFLLILAMTVTYVLRNYSLSEMKEAIRETSPIYLVFALGIMFLYFVCEGMNIARGLRLTGNQAGLTQGMKYAFTGFFFSSITPSASGGQPMQLYQMHKNQISVGQGTLALLLEFISYQTVTVVLASAGLFFQWERIHRALGSQWVLLLVGFSLNFLMMILVYLILFFPQMVNKLRRFQVIEHHFGQSLTEYEDGASIIKKNKGIMIPYYLTTTIQMLAMYSVPYLVYLSYDFGAYKWMDVVLLQAVLYVAVSALPIPGAMGISESGFTKLFRILFPLELLGGAMVLSRGISFYFYVLLTGCICAATILLPASRIKLFEKRRKDRKPAWRNA